MPLKKLPSGLRSMSALTLTAVLMCGALSPLSAARKKAPAFKYKDPALFFPVPTPNPRKPWLVRNFGPVGIGIKLSKPGLTMEINNVEKGSPAEKTGKLKKGQIIESINGQILGDRDPRVTLGDIITRAEETDGSVKLKIKGSGVVEVKIPLMGSYSSTWPVKCQKSEKIVRNLAALLAKQGKPKWGSVLFMLSTGEDDDLAVVKRWMQSFETVGGYPWDKGYKGPGLCEYYLRTGDERVLPIIKKMTEELKVLEYNGGWSGRGKAAFTYMGGGQMHAAGVHCLTFLLLARYCGVDVDEGMLQRSLKAFFAFAGHGNVAYGDQLPEGGFRDNGKTGGLAVAMAAAARLTPEGETSVYANARDNSAIKSFYATNWFHAAHTGGGIGEIWHHAAMGLMHKKRPVQYRSYLDTRRWVMELSRRWDGSIGIAGMDDGYDRSASEHDRSWGTYFALTYTLPRKQLQLYGAPKTPWCKNYQLPKRPWGTAEDDKFQLLTPVPEPGAITMKEILTETVPTDSSAPLMGRIGAEASKKGVLTKYLCHPDFGIRSATMRKVVENGRSDLVLPLLRSDDPRSRHNGLLAIVGMFKGRALPNDKLTPEMFVEVGKMIENPQESWWVLQDAINAIRRADRKTIAKHRDRLIQLLDYDSWWIQMATVKTLTLIATDNAHYKTVLPPLLKTFSSFTIETAQYSTMKDLSQQLASASPAVKTFAFDLLNGIYASMPNRLVFPGGQIVPRAAITLKARVSGLMQVLPGGDDFVKRLPRKTTAYAKSGKDSDLYRYSGRFTPNKRIAGTWAWAVWPRPKDEKSLPAAASKWVKSAEKQIANYNKLPASKKRGRNRKRLWKDTLELLDGGTVKSGGYFKGYFWSDDMLIGINSGIAQKMEVRNFAGKDFLIIETGGFDKKDSSSDWSKKYTIYMRLK